MKLIFIDETTDAKYKDYLGLCISIVDSTHYKNIKRGFQKILRDSNWDESIEFKGSHIFSATRGDKKVDIPGRIDIVEKILNLNISAKNARMRFYYAKQNKVKNHKQAYLSSIPSLLHKILPSPSKGRGKDLISLSCDHRSDIKPVEIHRIVEPVLNKKGYTILEHVTMPISCFDTVGILFTDIVCYLASRYDVISHDVELFNNIPKEELLNNGKVKKLISSQKLLKKIKNMNLYEKK